MRPFEDWTKLREGQSVSPLFQQSVFYNRSLGASAAWSRFVTGAPPPEYRLKSVPPRGDIISVMKNAAALLAFTLAFSTAGWAADYPKPVEGDYTVRDFQFHDGEKLAELK